MTGQLTLPVWIVLWLVISTIIVFADAGYANTGREDSFIGWPVHTRWISPLSHLCSCMPQILVDATALDGEGSVPSSLRHGMHASGVPMELNVRVIMLVMRHCFRHLLLVSDVEYVSTLLLDRSSVRRYG
jgi:hypothetical protein